MGHRAIDLKSAGLGLKLATTISHKLFVSSQLCLKKYLTALPLVIPRFLCSLELFVCDICSTC